MNAERWQAIGELFEQALPLPVGERTALLDDACGVDEELRREVASLLASHQAGGGFLQHRIEKALASFHDTSVAGTQPVRVGPYRLIRELGRGGMGTVFLAERDDDEYYAQVAVKLVRPGMDIEFILARFRRERQTLARLQHPNISRLLDGGTTENGLPYFVMEYIDGPWLTAFAADRRMPVDDRLRMFLDVCSAVEYAHRNFIIHRDLKPGNILVDPDGVPKLVDFGICKLLRAGAISATDSAVAPMTPDYASPEQMRGDAVTPLSDIYSLGAVLYELLTGTCPRRYARLTRVAIEQMSRAGIALPSTVAGDQAVARQLKGDLDSILMRALETEPERRYEGAAQLAEDLRRYLHHEPVRARPQTARYRAVKFVRRHRGHVVAAAAVFVALSAALAVSVYEARVASSRQQQVRMMADKLVFDVETMMEDGDPGAKRAVQQESIRVLEDAATISPGNVALKIYLALVNQHLGDSYTAAADIATAHQAYVRSADIASSGLKSGHASLHILFIQTNRRLALNAIARGRRGEALEFAGAALHAGENPPPGSGPLRALPRGLAAMGLTWKRRWLARNRQRPLATHRGRDDSSAAPTRAPQLRRRARPGGPGGLALLRQALRTGPIGPAAVPHRPCRAVAQDHRHARHRGRIARSVRVDSPAPCRTGSPACRVRRAAGAVRDGQCGLDLGDRSGPWR